jgi:hypothetical protein
MKTANIANDKRIPEPSPQGLSIDFNELYVNDIILIRTPNTSYSFVITSKRGMQGQLCGDSRDHFFPEAVLVGSLIKNVGQVQMLMSRLETQTQALFFAQRGNQLLEVVTPPIISLCWIRPI